MTRLPGAALRLHSTPLLAVAFAALLAACTSGAHTAPPPDAPGMDAGVNTAGDAGSPPPDAGTLIPDAGTDDAGTQPLGWHRDWAAHPAVVSITAPGELWALSDVHGGYARAVELLANAGLAQTDASGHAVWTGGNAVLVVVGDLIDKGPQSVETVDLFRELQADAPRTGGRVIVTLGNHEAEFLADPRNHKTQALADELTTLGLTPEQFASTDSRWGAFLHERPIAAVVNGWFFCHSGDAGGRTLDQLASEVRSAVDADDWGAAVFVAPDSPLEARDWYDAASLDAELALLGARHVVMGHDPHAFSEDGLIGAHFNGRLVHIDTGMSPAVDYSKGRLLEISGAGGTNELAWSVSHLGHRTALDLSAP